MRQFTWLGFVSAAVLLLPSLALAQRPRLKIDKVKIGFPVEPLPGEFKSGAWTPVYIDIVAPPEGVPVPGEVSVECNDTDDVRNSYSVRLRPLESNERVSILTYTRPGNMHGDISVRVKLDGQSQDYTHKENYSAMGLGHVLYVVAGARLGGFRRALGVEFKQANPSANPQQEDDEDAIGRDTGPRRLAFMDDVRQMPTRWFAYECVDVVFLTTGNRDFVNALLSDQENRREALAEWVRRGGRLIISTGKNQDMLANLGPALQPLLPAEVAGKVELQEVNALRRLSTRSNPFTHPRPRNLPNAEPPKVELARLLPKPSKQAEATLEEQRDLPLLVKGTHGLGRVALVAFDLDLPPFTAWNGQPDVWRRLRSELQREQLPQGSEQRGMIMAGGDGNESLSALQRTLEDFEDVPVISFGWVALFILVYILIVGPLDYFFLKKVVKRLELTWITFPTVVVAISVAAYFTAYHLKGNDQKINKLDLVDIDLQGQQAFGQTWFTIFSPRIQHYNIGIEPVNPEWAPPPPGGNSNRDYSVVTTWLGRPELGWGGAGRGGSQSLFRRTYEYEPDAVALKGVPIQVWTTKSFFGTWESPLPANRPLLTADLKQPAKKPEQLTGTLTSGLPVELEDVWVYHNRGDGGKWYSLDRLLPNNPRRLDSVLRGEGLNTAQWLEQRTTRVTPRNQRPSTGPSEPLQDVLKAALFQGAEQRGNRRNTGIRYLDQSYRLTHQEELILFGRVARQEGAAEDVTMNPASPTRLWLRDLPGTKKNRLPVPGTMSQETYVRVFLPVQVVKEN
jgi:hypothetical protein